MTIITVIRNRFTDGAPAPQCLSHSLIIPRPILPSVTLTFANKRR
ncbi:hypothetical protein M2405_004278 [Rhodococcus erythropolis]|nr:hypothetical protein [Rhodococcus erythropolis]MCW2425492.1 hypothetical protein [Rhodococcus erythropolis]